MWVYLRAATFLLILLFGPPAQAWTNAHVDQARVETELLADGRAHVLVALDMRVEGGWLEALELPGFDAMVTLDERVPAVFTATDGRTFQPQATLSGQGNLSLTFTRRQAPRRGEYTLRFGYFAEPSASADSEGLRVGFSLPGFQSGLERASVVLDVPAGAEAVIDPELALAPRVERTGGRTRVSFERLHLPRSTPWTVQVALPGAPAGRAVSELARGSGRDAWVGLGLAGAVLALGHAARSLRGRRRERAGAFASAAARLPRGAAELTAVVGACWWTWSVEAALLCWLSASIALALLPGFRDALRVPFGRLVPVPSSAYACATRAARRAVWGLRTPFDATSVLGALSLCALVLAPTVSAGAYALDGSAWGIGLMCAAPAWFAGNRLAAEPDLFAQLGRLRVLAGELEVHGWAASLRWVETRRGPRGVRLTFSPAARLTGVWSVEAQVSEAGDAAPRIRLSIDACLEEAVVRHWAERVVTRADGIGGRRVLLVAERDVGKFLSWLNVSAAARARAFLRAPLPSYVRPGAPVPTAKSA